MAPGDDARKGHVLMARAGDHVNGVCKLYMDALRATPMEIMDLEITAQRIALLALGNMAMHSLRGHPERAQVEQIATTLANQWAVTSESDWLKRIRP